MTTTINDLKNSSEIISNILSDYKFKELQNGLIYSKNRKGIESVISLEVATLGDGSVNILVYCKSKIEVSSFSLADHSKAYLTTSARIVKNKNLKTQKWVSTINESIVLIKKHITKF